MRPAFMILAVFFFAIVELDEETDANGIDETEFRVWALSEISPAKSE